MIFLFITFSAFMNGKRLLNFHCVVYGLLKPCLYPTVRDAAYGLVFFLFGTSINDFFSGQRDL